MGAFLQLIKDFLLIITTGFIIFWFLIDCRKALSWYLFFYAFISLIGLSRAIYNENIVIPLMLLLVLASKSSRISNPNMHYIALLIYMIFITYLNGFTIIDSYSSGTYLFVILLIYSSHLFSDSDSATKIVFFIWLITLGFAFNSFIFGVHIFSTANINSEERNLIIDSGIQGDQASVTGIDLNYFSSVQAIGAMISLMFIVYRKDLLSIVTIPVFLKKIFTNESIPIVLYLILVLEVWLVFRGLSRGGLLIFLAGGIAFIILLRKTKYLFLGGLFILGLYFVMNKIGIVNLFMERIANDASDGTSGRDLIAYAIFNSVYSQGGIMQIIFGGGNGWPWWEFWFNNPWDPGKVPSTHNQWLSIFVNFGLLGLGLFLIPLFKAIKNSLKNNNPINNIRIVLFICVFIYSMSLEPLIYTPFIWFLLAIAATYTPNVELIS